MPSKTVVVNAHVHTHTTDKNTTQQHTSTHMKNKNMKRKKEEKEREQKKISRAKKERSKKNEQKQNSRALNISFANEISVWLMEDLELDPVTSLSRKRLRAERFRVFRCQK